MNRQRVTFLKDDDILDQRTVSKFDLSQVHPIPENASDISVVWINEQGQPTSRFELYMIGTRDQIESALFKIPEEAKSFRECDDDRFIYNISTGDFQLLERELQMVS